MKWLIAVLLISSPAYGELNKKNLAVVLGLAPVAFFHEDFYHESAHAIMVKSVMPIARISYFAPYPNIKYNKFYMGYMEYTYPVTYTRTNFQDVIISLSPYMVDITAFTISDVMLSRMDRKTTGAASLYVLGIVAPLINFGMNFINGLDWSGVREKKGHIVFDIVGGVVLVVGTWRAIHHGIRVLRR